MIRILLASHSYMAKRMKDTAELIMGKQSNLKCLSAYEKDNFDMQYEVNKIITSSLKYPNDKLIVLTDLFGGSVNNAFLEYYNKHKNSNFYLISGMNFPLLIVILTKINTKDSLEKIIMESIEEAKKAIIFNNFLSSNNIKDDDF